MTKQITNNPGGAKVIKVGHTESNSFGANSNAKAQGPRESRELSVKR